MYLWDLEMLYPIYRVGISYVPVTMQTRHKSRSALRMVLERDLAFVWASSFALQPNSKRSLRKTRFQNQPDRESKWVVVLFLATHPTALAWEELLKTYVGPEELFLLGQEVYIYYPDGIGRSKLSQSFLERKLKTSGTARNWNTVLKLQELMN